MPRLRYKFTPNTELTYSYRVGEMDGVFQRGNKIKLDNVVIQNHQLELKGAISLLRRMCRMKIPGTLTM